MDIFFGYERVLSHNFKKPKTPGKHPYLLMKVVTVFDLFFCKQGQVYRGNIFRVWQNIFVFDIII